MISHKYKCIFVHIPKVAGQSIEHVFLDLHGLTWETRKPLLMYENPDPTKGPPRLAHLKAKEYVEYGYLTQNKFDSYYKFAFVRNPWARLISIYRYLGYSDRRSFKDFLMNEFVENEWKKNNWFVGQQIDYINDDEGRRIVDFVGRLEDLQTGFNTVCEHINLPHIELPHANRSDRKNDNFVSKVKKVIKKISPIHKSFQQYNHYSKYYDKESERFVADLYADDIREFKYKFNEK